MEVVGVSREGKLVPPVLRWLSYEQQGEILDAMEARFDMIKDFAAQTPYSTKLMLPRRVAYNKRYVWTRSKRSKPG
jgi:hypothetical protein